MRRLLLAWAMVVVGCSGPATEPSPGAPTAEAAPSAPVPSAAPASASAAAAIPLVGEWLGEHRCEQIVEILTAADLPEQIPEAIVGNGLLPGVTSPAAIPDPADPCAGTIVVPHSHLFAADGTFASFDGQHQQVDDGTWTLVDEDTFQIGETRFTFVVDADDLTLEPDPSAVGTDDYGWATMVSLPGQVWHRVAGS